MAEHRHLFSQQPCGPIRLSTASPERVTLACRDQVRSRIDLGDIMSISKPAELRNDALENSIRDAATQNAANLRIVRGGEGEIVADNLGQMIGRLSGSSIAEIDRLVSDLRAVRQHLENERDRVQRAITEFAYLSQSSVKSTAAIAEAVEEMKRAADLRARS